MVDWAWVIKQYVTFLDSCVTNVEIEIPNLDAPAFTVRTVAMNWLKEENNNE